MKPLLLIAFLLIAIPPLLFSQSAEEGYFTTKFVAQKKYLQLPVSNAATDRVMEILDNQSRVRWFDIGLSGAPADWYAYLDLTEWQGKELELRFKKKAGEPLDFKVVQSDQDTNKGPLYKESYRGQIHFSPNRGWNNDPNGLAYYKGEYHLFFQYNPYALKPGNMSWGHATSKDLVHWKQYEIALYPDKAGIMFSGSGVVDSMNTSGLGSKDHPPLVLFYTAAVDTWSQGLAYTLDGRNFKKLDNPVLDKIIAGNRDPKVIWYTPHKKWIMVLFAIDEGGRNIMYFYTSPDMKKWDYASKYYSGKGGDRYLQECPEFFEIALEGKPAVKKWILSGGNGEYAIGSFDGQTFRAEQERLSYQYGRGYYAGQTFNNDPKGRRIEIGWWQPPTHSEGMSFSQSMSLPAELKLVQTVNGPRLHRTPVAELSSLRKKTHAFAPLTLMPDAKNVFEGIATDLAEIRLVADLSRTQGLVMDLRGVSLRYNVKMQEIFIDDIALRVPAPLKNGQLELTIYMDRTGMEIFVNNGAAYIPLPLNHLPVKLNPENKNYSLLVTGGEAQFKQLDFYELKSIWD